MHRILFLTLISALLLAQTGAPVLDVAYGFDTFVTGTAAPGAGMIVVYDISYPARTKLGEGRVDSHGKFAISLKPPLVAGNRLVAEDASKRVSAQVTVKAPRPAPAPRPGQ